MRERPPPQKPTTGPDQGDAKVAQDRKAGAAKHKKLIGKWLSRTAFEKLTGRPGRSD
jgi:hypothetical protein